MRIFAISDDKYNYRNGCSAKNAFGRFSYHTVTSGKDEVNFRSNTSAGNVLRKLKGLTCPYYGVKMISGSTIVKVEAELDKCVNVGEVVKILKKYTPFMQKIEKKMFKRFSQAAKENPEQTMQACLWQWYGDAITKLKLEEFLVLDKVDKFSSKLSPYTALNLRYKTTRCRQIILLNNKEDTFKRKTFLVSLDEIKPRDEELSIYEKIKDQAIFLPTSNTSENAFIVKYADRSQQEIAKRLLRPSVATIEHVRPDSKGGANSLDNFLLVSASANNYRSNMPLAKYIHRFPKIPFNCQKYINEIINIIHKGKLTGHETYPYKISKTLDQESAGQIKLDLSKYKYNEQEAALAERRQYSLIKR